MVCTLPTFSCFVSCIPLPPESDPAHDEAASQILDEDFEASEDDAFGDGEGEAELTAEADEAAFGFATTASEDELFDGEDEDDGDDFDLAEFGLADER